MSGMRRPTVSGRGRRLAAVGGRWAERIAVLPLALLAACASNVVPEDPGALAVDPDGASRQVLVTVHQESGLALGLVGDPDSRYTRRRGYDATPSVERTMDRIARDHGIRRVRGWPIASLDVFCEVFEAGIGRDLDELLRALEADPRVELAQRMNVFETQTTGYNDPYADLQKSMALLDVEAAHRMATGKGVTVAVIDSQVDLRHPDLAGRVELSRNLVDGGFFRSEAEIHGTAVAGVIASVANNTEGIVGVAPDVELEVLRACWSVDETTSGARCSSFSLAQALEAALELGPSIVNLSLAGPEDPLLASMLDVAIERHIVIVAAVLETSDGVAFPASHPGVIAARSELSHAGSNLPLIVSAPGSEVLTTTPHASYAFLSGNSLAAAHVSGVIALLRERDQDIGAGEIVQLLAETATSEGSMHSINACRAVARLASEDDPCLAQGQAIARAAR